MSKVALELIASLREKRVELWVEHGNLKYRAPKGAIPDADFAQMRVLREEIIEEISRSAASAGRPRSDADAHQPFPLTDIQFAYLIGRRPTFEWGGVGCHGYLEFHHDHAIDVERLDHAFQTLVERHPMLRTVFSSDGTQTVLSHVPTFTSDHQRTDIHFDLLLKSRRDTMSHRLYDGGTWPLFHVAVSETRDCSVLHLSFDLLVADFSGFALLLGELERLYRNPFETLPALTYSFRDYVLDLEEYRNGVGRATYEADKTWWLRRIDTLPGRPELPAEPGTWPDARFERIAMRVGTAEWSAIQHSAAARELTPSSSLLAAFCEVVGKWSRTEHFTIALPLLDRMPLNQAVNNVVGDFTSVSLLEVNHDPTVDFLARARACQNQLWQDLDHRAFSGVEMAREVARRSGQGGVLYPVVFTSTIGQPMLREGEWNFVRARYGITQTPQVWLDCQLMLDGDDLVIHWDFRVGAIRRDVLDAMAESFSRLLLAMANDASVWHATDPVQLPADQVQHRALSNATYRDIPPGLIHQPALAAAARAPHAVAVIANDRAITNAELLRAATRVGEHLRERGLQPGERAAILARKGPEQIIAAFGVLLAGGAYVPIDAHQPEARRNRILANSGVRHAIVEAGSVSGKWPDVVQRIELEAAGSHPSAPPAMPSVLASEASADATAYVIYTSGSTGEPKGVVISHRAANNTLQDLAQRLALGPDDAVLGIAHLGFDLSVFDIFGVLGCAGRLVLPSPERLSDPSHWVKLLQLHRITMWNSVPAQAQMLADYLEANIDACAGIELRHILLSGDWIPTGLPSRLSRLLPGASIMSLGGATEAAIWSIFHMVAPQDAGRASIPYGKPLGNQKFYVLDRGLRDRPDGVSGDLYIGGAGLADEYLGDEVKTAAAFRTHPKMGCRIYRTGDLGRYDDTGTIELLGRSDLQVKVLGHRIELLEIDAAATALSEVAAAAAVALGERTNLRIALAVKPAPNRTIDVATLITELKSRLPDYMVPTIVHVVERMPQSQNAKIDRVAIARIIASHLEENTAAADAAPPEGKTEEVVAAVFQNTLMAGQVAREDDFLDMGGNSLLAARVVTQLREKLPHAHAFGFDELLVMVLRQRTIAALSAAIDQRRLEDDSKSALLRITGDEASRPTSLVVFAINRCQADATVARLSSLQDDFAISVITVDDVEAWLRIPPGSAVDRYVDAAFDLLAGEETSGRFALLGCGELALAALETGRRFRENGFHEIAVVAVEDADDATTEAMTHWRASTKAFMAYPYLGEVTLVGRPRLYGSDWEDVAMGRVRALDRGTAIEEAIRASLPDGRGADR